jgi:hypothetical protein
LYSATLRSEKVSPESVCNPGMIGKQWTQAF